MITLNKISKATAIEKNLKFYCTGEPCRQGHYSNRYVSNSKCAECVRLNTKKTTAKLATGYTRAHGRPKLDEVRPPSLNAIRQADYTRRRLEQDPSYRETLNLRARLWRLNNRARSNEIKRNSELRLARRAKLAALKNQAIDYFINH